MKLSFSLGSKAKPKATTGEAPALRKPAAFGSLDDEDTVDAAPVASSSKKPVVPLSTGSWRASRKKDAPVDVTVKQYDEVYDAMKEAERQTKASSEEHSKDNKSKYMEKLLQSAETRKLDYVRAEEWLMQREREKEGDEFADKDKFVTPAYKAQMEEVRRAEAEEKKRMEAEAKNRKAAPGLAALYRDLLQKGAEQNDAAIAAANIASTANDPEASGRNLTIRKPLKIAPDPDSVFKPPTETDLAEQARAEGKDVEMNDDGQLVDKRDLLSAGLNLSAPNTRKLGLSSKSTSQGNDEAVVHRAAGTAASRQEIRARQAKELERQYKEERERVAAEAVRQEEEERQRLVKRKNTEGDVQSAKERYLERKRQRLAEQPMEET